MLILLSGCVSTLKVIPAEISFVGIDFRPYTEKEFLFTPEKYEGPYESIGLIEYVFVPEANYVPTKTFQDGSANYKWIQDPYSIDEALKSYYEKAIEMGADCVINLKLEPVNRSYTSGVNPVTLQGIRISGFAILRGNK